MTERPAPQNRTRTAAVIALLVLATGVVVVGFLLDLSIVVVWPITFAVVLLGFLAIALLTRAKPPAPRSRAR